MSFLAWIVLGLIAGFIGSNLVDRLLENGHDVIGYDNFSTGQREFLTSAMKSSHFKLVEGDLLYMAVRRQSRDELDNRLAEEGRHA